MKLRTRLFALLGLAAALVGCRPEEADIALPQIKIGGPALNFDEETKLASCPLDMQLVNIPLTVTANRDWTAEINWDSDEVPWIAVTPESGVASDQPQQVTLTVLNNAGYNRNKRVKFSIGYDYKTIDITQTGERGEEIIGTLDNPLTVAGAVKYVKSLGADVQSSSGVYVKGKISRIDDGSSFAASGTYGNATFYISDDGGTSSEQFYCYRVLYLGNKKWTSKDPDIKVGDDVIIYGHVVNYKGNTPETVQGTAFIYDHNGVNRGTDEGGGGGNEGTPAGSGTQADPYNVAAARAAVKDLTWTANDNYEKTGTVYVKGKISRIADNGTFGQSGTFGNATFYINDDGADGAELYAYRILYLGNKKYTSGDDVKPGDSVIICAELMNYRGNTPETVQGTGYLYSLNGKTDGGGQSTQPDDPSDVQQITCAEFIAKADQNTVYRLKGEVTSSVNTTYCSFDMNDGTATVVVWTVNNKDEWKNVVKKGGTVTVRGKYQPYNQSDGTVKHEMVDAYIEAFTAGDPGPSTPGTPSGDGTLQSPYNAAAANQVASALADGEKTDSVYVAGKISSIKYTFSAQYGTATFDISDDGSTSGTQFTCYSVYYLGSTPWEDGHTQIKVGDSVIIRGLLCNYQGNTPETSSKEAYIYSLNGNTVPEEVGGGGGGGEQPSGDFASNVTWTDGSNGAYTQKAKVNGSETTILKLGTGSAIGSSTITCPAASTKLSFYAISWKDKPSELIFKVGGKQVASVKPAANSGLAGNPTYTISVKDSDHYTIDLGSAVTEVTVETTGSNPRAALFAIIAE